jgi:hypothetical protein
MDCQEGNVRQRIHRGLQQMRHVLEKKLGVDWRRSPAVLALVAGSRRPLAPLLIPLASMMSKPFITASAATLVLGLAAILWTTDLFNPASGSIASEEPSITGGVALESNEESRGEEIDPGRNEVRSMADELQPDPLLADPSSIPVNIRVVDDRNGDVLPMAEVAYMSRPFDWYGLSFEDRERIGRLDDDFALYQVYGRETVADARGQLTLALQEKLFLAGRVNGLYGLLYLEAASLEAEQVHELRLRPDLQMRVRVIDAAGKPAAHFPLGLQGRWDDPAMDGKEEEEATRRIYTSFTTDAKGVAVLGHLQEWMKIVAGNSGPPDQAVLFFPLPDESQDLRVFDLDDLPTEVVELQAPPTGSILMRVVDAEGSLRRDVQDFYLRYGEGEMRRTYSSCIEPLSDGICRFNWLPLGKRYGVDAAIDNGGNAIEMIVDGPRVQGEELEVEIRAESAAVSLVGRVVDMDGRPLSRHRLRLQQENEHLPFIVNFNSDAEGRFRVDLGDEYVGGNLVNPVLIHIPGLAIGERMGSLALPETIPAGLTDLGDVILPQGETLVTGRVRIDGELPRLRPAIIVDRAVPDEVEGTAWERLRAFQVRWLDRERFEVVALPHAGRFRIRAEAASCPPSAFQDFAAGQRDLSFELRSGGSLQVRVHCDDMLSLGQMVLSLVSEASASWRPAGMLQTWKPRFGGEPSDDFTWRGIPDGSYRIEVYARGHVRPIRQVAGIQIQSSAEHESLEVDLRGALRMVTLDLTDPAGEPLRVPRPLVFDLETELLPQSLVDWEARRPYEPRWGRNTFSLLIEEPLDLWVVAEGYQPQRLHRVGADRQVRMEPLAQMTVHLPDLPALPEGSDWHLQVHHLHEGYRIEDVTSLSIPHRAELAIEAGGSASFGVIPGEAFGISLAIHFPEVNVHVPGTEPMRVIGEAGAQLQLRVPAEGLAAAMRMRENR